MALLLATCLAAADDVQFSGSLEHPAIDYAHHATTDRVADLNRRILAREITLRFDAAKGYLPSTLEALGLPIESQLLVFSKTSLQSRFIGPKNPRAIFFDDTAAVAWIPGAPLLEVATQDREQGVIFYGLPQLGFGTPQFLRMDATCLTCHVSSNTLSVPGMALGSVGPERDGSLSAAQTLTSDHRTPFARRWGGWYVTGTHGATPHRGNAFIREPDDRDVAVGYDTVNVETLGDRFDVTRYPGRYSDIAALMVLNHQAHLTNLLTRIGWETRMAASERRPLDVDDLVRPLVDYMLFVDEAPLEGPIRGRSGFAETFSARGPRDRKGRSLHELDLNARLLRYPCSYMIYTAAFDGLPDETRGAIYRRLWQVLSGRDTDEKYGRLLSADRAAVIEILRETKPGVSAYFK
jgi:hypothetical protein